MFCLDTNIVIYYQNNNQLVKNRLLNEDENNLCITQVTRAELFYGVYNSSKITQNLAVAKDFCQTIEVILPSSQSDEIFGRIKSELKTKGKIVADLDLMIASICLANGLTLVTANTKHFENIQGLKLENWTL
jgi:predicted nucleic acid-binding protein